MLIPVHRHAVAFRAFREFVTVTQWFDDYHGLKSMTDPGETQVCADAWGAGVA
jgi:hypothetical protein